MLQNSQLPNPPFQPFFKRLLFFQTPIFKTHHTHTPTLENSSLHILTNINIPPPKYKDEQRIQKLHRPQRPTCSCRSRLKMYVTPEMINVGTSKAQPTAPKSAKKPPAAIVVLYPLSFKVVSLRIDIISILPRLKPFRATFLTLQALLPSQATHAGQCRGHRTYCDVGGQNRRWQGSQPHQSLCLCVPCWGGNAMRRLHASKEPKEKCQCPQSPVIVLFF